MIASRDQSSFARVPKIGMRTSDVNTSGSVFMTSRQSELSHRFTWISLILSSITRSRTSSWPPLLRLSSLLSVVSVRNSKSHSISKINWEPRSSNTQFSGTTSEVEESQLSTHAAKSSFLSNQKPKIPLLRHSPLVSKKLKIGSRNTDVHPSMMSRFTWSHTLTSQTRSAEPSSFMEVLAVRESSSLTVTAKRVLLRSHGYHSSLTKDTRFSKMKLMPITLQCLPTRGFHVHFLTMTSSPDKKRLK